MTKLGSALALLFSMGCSTTYFSNGPLPEIDETNPFVASYANTHDVILLSLYEMHAPEDLSRPCPGRWARNKTEQSAASTLLTVVSVGIFTPYTVEVSCAKAPVIPAAAADPPALP
ncbi:MAG: hypothetical protein AB7F66_01885 [Bacteriovoracia bacterium]